MAHIMTKCGSQDNVVTYEYICDTTADMLNIDPHYINLGSTCTVLNGTAGIEVYIATSEKEWIALTTINNGGASSNSNLPQVSSIDNGQVLTVVQGAWNKANPQQGWIKNTESSHILFDGPVTGDEDLLTSSTSSWDYPQLTVVFDGTTYTVVRHDREEGIYFGDGDYESFPFLLSYNIGDEEIEFTTLESANHTLTITSPEIIHVISTDDFKAAVGYTTQVIDNITIYNISDEFKAAVQATRGANTVASGLYSHAEGFNTIASNYNAHVEGNNNTASGHGAHAEGSSTQATGDASHAEGIGTQATNITAHAEGGNTTASGQFAHAEGDNTVASQRGAHAEGYYSTASAQAAHAEGNNTSALAYGAHAEGDTTYAREQGAHSEGVQALADAYAAHAEGYATSASGQHAHAEGDSTSASAASAHAEGTYSVASGNGAHAEGDNVEASGDDSHAEGYCTVASGTYSHAEGSNTVANHLSQHVFGEYNVADNSNVSSSRRGTYVEIVGNGTAANARANARTLDWLGNEQLAGSLTLGRGTANEVTISATQLKQLLALLN